MSLAEARNVVEKDDGDRGEDEHGASEDEVVSEGVDDKEENEGKNSFEEEGLADLVEAILLLDDGIGTFADGFESFIKSEEHNDGKFVGVVAAEETEEEGENKHGGTAPEAGVEIIGIGDVLGGIGDLESATAINADHVKNAGGRKGKGKDAGVVDTVEASGKHEEEERSEIPAGGADDIPDEIATEGGGGGFEGLGRGLGARIFGIWHRVILSLIKQLPGRRD